MHEIDLYTKSTCTRIHTAVRCPACSSKLGNIKLKVRLHKEENWRESGWEKRRKEEWEVGGGGGGGGNEGFMIKQKIMCRLLSFIISFFSPGCLDLFFSLSLSLSLSLLRFDVSNLMETKTRNDFSASPPLPTPVSANHFLIPDKL